MPRKDKNGKCNKICRFIYNTLKYLLATGKYEQSSTLSSRGNFSKSGKLLPLRLRNNMNIQNARPLVQHPWHLEWQGYQEKFLFCLFHPLRALKLASNWISGEICNIMLYDVTNYNLLLNINLYLSFNNVFLELTLQTNILKGKSKTFCFNFTFVGCKTGAILQSNVLGTSSNITGCSATRNVLFSQGLVTFKKQIKFYLTEQALYSVEEFFNLIVLSHLVFNKYEPYLSYNLS